MRGLFYFMASLTLTYHCICDNIVYCSHHSYGRLCVRIPTSTRGALVPLSESSPVRRQRKSRGLTQVKLAERAGISPSTISDIECWRNPEIIKILMSQGVTPRK